MSIKIGDHMAKIKIAATFEEKVIKIVRRLIQEGGNEAILDPQRFPYLKVVISEQKPTKVKLITTIPVPPDLKESLTNKDIYITTKD